MKKLIRNKQHDNSRSHDVTICEHNSKKLKFTYEAYNADEKYTVELFGNDKWNKISILRDLGEKPNTSAFNILTPKQRETKANRLYLKATKYVKLFLS